MNNINELAAALSRAQGKVENAKKLSKNPHFKSNYADLGTIWDTIREPFASEGLAVLQLPVPAPDGKVGLTTILLHSSGQSVTETYYMGLKDTTNPQQVGSCLTYMKRYALLGVAGIASEDDDGEAATGRKAPERQTIKESPVDYSETIKETMAHLEKATDTEARALYATIRNSRIQEPTKGQLLSRMAEFITTRAKKVEAKA